VGKNSLTTPKPSSMGQNQVIVAADVVTDESDNYQLVRMMDQVEENLGRVAEETVADGGYFATTELASAEEKQYPVLVNLPESVDGPENQPYHTSRFVYDVKNDQCICPRGERLVSIPSRGETKRILMRCACIAVTVMKPVRCAGNVAAAKRAERSSIARIFSSRRFSRCRTRASCLG